MLRSFKKINKPSGLLLMIAIIGFVYLYNSKQTSILNTQNADVYVIKVYDGDTLTAVAKTNPNEKQNKMAREQIKVRLFGIDAPELKQAWGKQSRDYLRELCLNKEAKLEIKDSDKYGRKVAKVYCGGIEANRALVQKGLAHAYREYSLGYVSIEIKAKEQRKGLWADDEVILPSDFRKENK